MKLLVVLVSLVVYVSAVQQLPSYIQVCRPKHEDVSECIKRNVEIIRPHFVHGIPELFLPQLNPYKVARAQVKIGQNIKGTIQNAELRVKDFDIQDLKIDLDDFKLSIKIKFNEIQAEGNYRVTGRVLILNLDGRGHANLNLYGLVVNVEARGKKELRNGKEYIVPTETKIKPELERMEIRLENLFPNNTELTDRANELFNENQELLFEEFSPFAVNLVRGIISKIIRKFFAEYSYDVLFPDD